MFLAELLECRSLALQVFILMTHAILQAHLLPPGLRQQLGQAELGDAGELRENEMKRMFYAVSLLIVLLLVVFVVANWWVGSGSDTVQDVARSKCIEAGFPAETMQVLEYAKEPGFGRLGDIGGFGSHATVVFRRGYGRHGLIEFSPDGKRIPFELRVELRRRMNLMKWEAVGIVEGKDL
jgi:hypothetical protein